MNGDKKCFVYFGVTIKHLKLYVCCLCERKRDNKTVAYVYLMCLSIDFLGISTLDMIIFKYWSF